MNGFEIISQIIAVLLGITGIGIICILWIMKQECDTRRKERGVIGFLADEIRKLRKDVNDLKK